MPTYAAKIAPAPEGGFSVTFRDMPDATAQGRTLSEALETAQAALTDALAAVAARRRYPPPPSLPRDGEWLVSAPQPAAQDGLALAW